MSGLQSMERELGVSENEAATRAEALVSAILRGLKKQARSQPAGPERLGDLLGGLRGARAGTAASGVAPPGHASMLDLNGDGNAQDDILRITGKAMR